MATPFVADESLKNSAPGLFHFAGKPGGLSPTLMIPLAVLAFGFLAMMIMMVVNAFQR